MCVPRLVQGRPGLDATWPDPVRSARPVTVTVVGLVVASVADPLRSPWPRRSQGRPRDPDGLLLDEDFEGLIVAQYAPVSSAATVLINVIAHQPTGRRRRDPPLHSSWPPSGLFGCQARHGLLAAGHLAAYAGLAPVTRRSGSSSKGEHPAPRVPQLVGRFWGFRAGFGRFREGFVLSRGGQTREMVGTRLTP